MTNVAEIEKAIEGLPKNELAELSAWFDRFESDAWDDQIAGDAAAGKFESLYAEAVADFEAGRSKEL